jgi:hypothetical protein
MEVDAAQTAFFQEIDTICFGIEIPQAKKGAVE